MKTSEGAIEPGTSPEIPHRLTQQALKTNIEDRPDVGTKWIIDPPS